MVHGYGDHSGRYRRVHRRAGRRGLRGARPSTTAATARPTAAAATCDAVHGLRRRSRAVLGRLRAAAQGKPTFLLAPQPRRADGAALPAAASPEGLKGLVLTSPYLELAFEPPMLKVLAAKAVGTIIPWLPVPTGINFEQLIARPRLSSTRPKHDPLYDHMATPRWFNEMHRAQAKRSRPGQRAQRAALRRGGRDDPMASPGGEQRVLRHASASSDKTATRSTPECVHEVLQRARARKQLWRDISRWISAHR